MPALRTVIADDDRITRSILSNILLEGGCDVAGQADNGADVVKLCLQIQPDVLFLDINMPKLNGFEALASIREGLPKVHVVMLSASSTLDNVRECMRLGVNSFIVKPFTPEKVLSALKTAKR